MAEASASNPLHPERLTWAVLLGQWVEFARSAVALPEEGEGGLMRASIADVVMLQAVWFSLQSIGKLDADERAVGLDRAGVLIERHAAALRERWGEAMPGGIVELIGDAERAMRNEEV